MVPDRKKCQRFWSAPIDLQNDLDIASRPCKADCVANNVFTGASEGMRISIPENDRTGCLKTDGFAQGLCFEVAVRRHFLDEQSTRRRTWASVALFDVIANNADRKSGHCLFDANDEVWVIDHGLTFNVDHKLRTVIWDFSGDPMPAELCGDVERALVDVEKGGLAKTLGGLISPAEVRMLKRRLRGVLAPTWRFPEPTSAWSVPWPPI